MNQRERYNGVMHFGSYDRMPVLHRGYTRTLLDKWAAEGHISRDEADGWHDSNDICCKIDGMLGFDHDFITFYSPVNGLRPEFTESVSAVFADGSRQMRNKAGVIVRDMPGSDTPPETIGRLLTDRETWQEHYLPKLYWTIERLSPTIAFDAVIFNATTSHPPAMDLGSIFALPIRIMGTDFVQKTAAEDPELLQEIFGSFAYISFENAKNLLEAGFRPDCVFFREDMTGEESLLLTPEFFTMFLQRHFQKISSLLQEYKCPLIGLDCSCLPPEMISFWLDCGVNLFSPFTFSSPAGILRASADIRGIGGMDVNVLSGRRQSVDEEIERLRILAEAGGFIPCPAAKLPPDTEWELVRYYTARLKEISPA